MDHVSHSWWPAHNSTPLLPVRHACELCRSLAPKLHEGRAPCRTTIQQHLGTNVCLDADIVSSAILLQVLRHSYNLAESMHTHVSHLAGRQAVGWRIFGHGAFLKILRWIVKLCSLQKDPSSKVFGLGLGPTMQRCRLLSTTSNYVNDKHVPRSFVLFTPAGGCT